VGNRSPFRCRTGRFLSTRRRRRSSNGEAHSAVSFEAFFSEAGALAQRVSHPGGGDGRPNLGLVRTLGSSSAALLLWGDAGNDRHAMALIPPPRDQPIGRTSCPLVQYPFVERTVTILTAFPPERQAVPIVTPSPRHLAVGAALVLPRPHPTRTKFTVRGRLFLVAIWAKTRKLSPVRQVPPAGRSFRRRVTHALCRDATKRQFDVIMAWSVDRLGNVARRDGPLTVIPAGRVRGSNRRTT